MLTETCSRCGQEVRWGWRHGRHGFWHREDVDHEIILGRVFTEEDRVEVERQRHLPRTREDKDGNLITYTTESFERSKMKKSKRDPELEEEGHDELEPIEIRSIDLPLKGRVFVACPDGSVALAATPGGVRTVLNLAAKIGWEVQRLTYSRGPYVGSSGKSLGVSDSVVLRIRRGGLDGTDLWALASWRDGKSDWAWQCENKTITRVGARALISWMKENPRGDET